VNVLPPAKPSLRMEGHVRTSVQLLDGNGATLNVVLKDLMRFTASVSYVFSSLFLRPVLTTSAPVVNN
jgi:hypothetical protein